MKKIKQTQVAKQSVKININLGKIAKKKRAIKKNKVVKPKIIELPPTIIRGGGLYTPDYDRWINQAATQRGAIQQQQEIRASPPQDIAIVSIPEVLKPELSAEQIRLNKNEIERARYASNKSRIEEIRDLPYDQRLAIGRRELAEQIPKEIIKTTKKIIIKKPKITIDKINNLPDDQRLAYTTKERSDIAQREIDAAIKLPPKKVKLNIIR